MGRGMDEIDGMEWIRRGLDLWDAQLWLAMYILYIL